MSEASQRLDEIICSALRRWKAKRSREGRAVTLLDLYAIVGEAVGVEPHELPREHRRILSDLAFKELWPEFEVAPSSSQRNDAVEIVDYDDDWPVRFGRWSRRLADVLGAGNALARRDGS